jgi:hypothetical protein
MRQTLKIFILTSWLSAFSAAGFAQQQDTPFRAYLINNLYNVYLRINFYDNNIVVPGQELYGKLPGYLGKVNNSFCWVIVSSKLISDKEAEIQMINDFGSDDLTATLTQLNDSVYQLKQVKGNVIKVPNKGKWQKLPKILEFKKK